MSTPQTSGEDLKGIDLTYRNLQHLNGDESRNDHAPFEHVVISFVLELQPLQYFELMELNGGKPK